MRDLDSPSLWRFVAPAVLLHVAAVGLLSLIPSGASPASPVAAANRRLVDVEVQGQIQLVPARRESVVHQARAAIDDRQPPASQGATTAAPARLAGVRMQRDQRPAPPGPADVAATEPGPDDAEGVALAPDRGRGGPEPGPTLSLEQLGVTLGPSGRALAPARRSPDARQRANRQLQRSMAAQLDAQDRERGLGGHGKVITALEVAARAESTPADGRAEFLVVVDEQGRVVGVEVLEVSSDYRAWQRAARRARRALGKSRVALPEGAAGVQMRLEITSRVQRPSGADPELEVSVFGIPLQRAEGKRPSKIEMLNPIPKLEWVEVPDPGTGEMRKLPRLQIRFTLLGLGFDPADIGAPVQRVVKGRVVDVHPL